MSLQTPWCSHSRVDFICPLLEKRLTEKKEVILIGDYNINILNSDVDHQASDF